VTILAHPGLDREERGLFEGKIRGVEYSKVNRRSLDFICPEKKQVIRKDSSHGETLKKKKKELALVGFPRQSKYVKRSKNAD